MMKTVAVWLLTCGGLAACMGGNSSADEPEAAVEQELPSSPVSTTVGNDEASGTAAEKSSPAPTREVCRSLLARARECQAVYLPALVAERVRLDIPVGIAASDRQGGREALLAEALEEYEHDSTDAAIEATCDQLAAALPPDRAERLVATGNTCLARAGCEPFAACAAPHSVQP
jgi:hypothetical protein